MRGNNVDFQTLSVDVLGWEEVRAEVEPKIVDLTSTLFMVDSTAILVRGVGDERIDMETAKQTSALFKKDQEGTFVLLVSIAKHVDQVFQKLAAQVRQTESENDQLLPYESIKFTLNIQGYPLEASKMDQIMEVVVGQLNTREQVFEIQDPQTGLKGYIDQPQTGSTSDFKERIGRLVSESTQAGIDIFHQKYTLFPKVAES